MMRFIGPILLVIALFVSFSATFIVPEGQQALVTQFGRIVGEPITQSGLHFKTPFIHDVRYLEKRILVWDGDPEQIPTKDKKYIWADTTARWKIIDAKKFAFTVKSINGAKLQLDSTLDGSTRDVISSHNLVEAVRNTNTILDKAEASEGDESVASLEEEDEITGEITRISVGREKLSQMIIESAREELRDYGIDLLDVQFRRIAYEKSVEAKVYDRMISERERIAEKIRSIGAGERAKIEGTRNLDLKQIESDAYRKSQEIRGEADAKAIAIYARAVKQDPDFYSFIRTLEAYDSSFQNTSKFILSSDSEFLKLIRSRK